MFISVSLLCVTGASIGCLLWLLSHVSRVQYRRVAALEAWHDERTLQQEDKYALASANMFEVVPVTEDSLLSGPNTAAQPQAPNAPFDPQSAARIYQGIDRHSFYPLGSRLLPCGHVHAPVAVDLVGRYWWWDASSEPPNWGFVPSHDACMAIYLEHSQWLSIAPLAADTLNRLMSGKEEDAGMLQKLLGMQSTLFAVWGVQGSHLGKAWLYESVTLSGRWLFKDVTPPQFCVFTLSILLHGTWGRELDGWVVKRLMEHPVTASMPELFNSGATMPPSDLAPKLVLLSGGKT